MSGARACKNVIFPAALYLYIFVVFNAGVEVTSSTGCPRQLLLGLFRTLQPNCSPQT